VTCCDRPIGSNACHCAACHRTFTAITPFDLHQRLDGERVVCMDPKYTRGRHGDLIFREVRQGVWGRNAERPPENFPVGI
jgi:hypothetical protein